MAKPIIHRERRGQPTRVASHRFDPAFIEALKKYSLLTGVAQGVLLERGVLKAYPEIRRALTAARASKQ